MIKARQTFITRNKSGYFESFGCNALMIANNGSATFMLNDAYPVYPGTSLSINQVDPRVCDMTKYKITFDPADATPWAIIMLTWIDQNTLPVLENEISNGNTACGIH